MRTSISDAAASPAPANSLRALIDHEAKAAGFDVVAVTSPAPNENASRNLAAFVGSGFHGSMDWMFVTQARRASPITLWPDVRSIIVLGMNYGPDDDPRSVHQQRKHGAISVYARHRDYHDLIKGRLKTVAGKFAAEAKCDVKVFVDTAPVMEKPLAQAAGLGWQGKHTNLVSTDLGSWLFLGTIFTTAEIPADAPGTDHCGSCSACLDACPTGAFPAPYRIDARRCISYLTIENKGPIPTEFRKAIGNRVYGCDDCLAACPWNKFAQAASEAKLIARDDLRAPALRDLLDLDDVAFRSLFSGSPIKRIGRDRFLRNVLVAAGNSSDLELVSRCEELVHDGSPLVRGAAVWALAQLLTGSRFSELAQRCIIEETDRAVIEEWQSALKQQLPVAVTAC